MKVVKMGLMSGKGFAEERKLELGMSYARSIRDQINRQHHKYFETEAFEKPYLFSKQVTMCLHLFYNNLFNIPN